MLCRRFPPRAGADFDGRFERVDVRFEHEIRFSSREKAAEGLLELFADLLEGLPKHAAGGAVDQLQRLAQVRGGGEQVVPVLNEEFVALQLLFVLLDNPDVYGSEALERPPHLFEPLPGRLRIELLIDDRALCFDLDLHLFPEAFADAVRVVLQFGDPELELVGPLPLGGARSLQFADLPFQIAGTGKSFLPGLPAFVVVAGKLVTLLVQVAYFGFRPFFRGKKLFAG